MNGAKAPRSLRAEATLRTFSEFDGHHGRKVSAVAGMIAVASIGGAEAQQSSLPAVTVDAPVARPKPAAARATPDQVRARTALRRAARRAQPTQVQPVPFPNAGTLSADRNPYADAAAPYKVDRLSGTKFTEPVLNTPRTVTVLTKELLEDKNATSLREVARSTAGVTLGTGEGGNAFGDRFFIRGFDARNDVFIDGIRDPAISIRENFFTEQVEILRGPASTMAGRGTAGGAINIVTKQATTEGNFTKAETTFGSDATKRVTVDVNQVLSPTLAVRVDGLYQDAKVAGRNYVTDDRWGTLAAVKWTPTDAIKVTANYVHTDLDGLPDFGVPYNTALRRPSTDVNVPRETYYGFVNRDFQKAKQDFGTVTGEFAITPDLTLTNRSRAAHSVLNYIGTLPSNPTATTVSLASQSRYQTTDVLANQTDLTYKFDVGGVKHTMVGGAEISRESVMRDTYAGLTSELAGFQSGGRITVPLLAPPNLFEFATQPQRAYNPTFINVDTKSAYVIETANWNDVVILNGGLRYDDYNITGHTAATSTSVQSGMWNYNLGAVVKPLPYASLYAAYATSTNPVGAELDASGTAYGGLVVNNATFQALPPEMNKAAEVGTKWELFDRRLLLTASLFETQKSNARETVGNNILSTGVYRVRGIDLEAAGKITDRWSVFGGLVLMDTKVLQSIDPNSVGAQLANIAHQSFNLLTKYKFDDHWEVGGQAVYASKIYGGTFAAINGNVLPEHWRFDSFVEFKVDKHMTAKLSVNNIFNTTYYDAFYRSNSPFVFIAPGRSVWLTLRGAL
ncbi:putative TonB-dependent receptor BfrD [Rhodopseudomonas palustris]|uniref:TonB-dependent receptor n=1 Tax=Rhodopseudomonas palustris (strain ATCC BAA-98 / CGA009) TaxID=258594 RepID=A0AAE9Y4Y0_RHOPA|nr:TonB-dependent receptor [Rhodopseudomonas palustris]OPF97712.1 TonB-dependent siderophore receptor [Rhodopseudomonas palustris]QQM05023.1 putative TonB-dependent receptor BfrD [Rhodopseudomonas palustris]RJF69343.1 TonB-dependent receptor [Rhodopseudomonas palustris]WAB76379.1 TonB-dependent receptor [Rhodopseudomonas palustris]WCL93651.1 TonB-dependent receptor [Rhodopseudomonas palustris CGA009]